MTRDCETLYKCLLVTMSYGVRMPGGIGDQMRHTLGTRYIIDLLFFLIVLIVLLNVIFGIIIDTFGDLRAQKLERQHNTTETCFICGIDKQVFDRASSQPNGFKAHINVDHNMWNYMYFIFYVWEQDRDDDDGLEQFVRRSVAMNDIGWFPMNKAMRLEMTKSAEEDLRNAIKEDIVRVEASLHTRLTQIQSDFGETLEKLVGSLQSLNKVDDISTPLQGRSVASESVDDDFSTTSSRQRSRGSRYSSKTLLRKRRMPRNDLTTTSLDEDEEGGSILSEVNGFSLSEYNKGRGESQQVSLEIDSLEDVLASIQSTSPTNISCRIVCDSGIHEVKCGRADGEIVKMKSRKVVVCEKSSSRDVRSCRVQLIKWKGHEQNIVAVVDLRYGELISLGNGGSIRREFVDNDDQPTGCFLMASVFVSHSYGVDEISVDSSW